MLGKKTETILHNTLCWIGLHGKCSDNIIIIIIVLLQGPTIHTCYTILIEI